MDKNYTWLRARLRVAGKGNESHTLHPEGVLRLSKKAENKKRRPQQQREEKIFKSIGEGGEKGQGKNRK